VTLMAHPLRDLSLSFRQPPLIQQSFSQVQQSLGLVLARMPRQIERHIAQEFALPIIDGTAGTA
jgi:hypothetical protein